MPAQAQAVPPLPPSMQFPPPQSAGEAAHQANVHFKAQRLFALGYSGRWSSEDEVEIISPNGDIYRVNAILQTCECLHFRQHGFCSHLWGWTTLMRGMAEEGACVREKSDRNDRNDDNVRNV